MSITDIMYLCVVIYSVFSVGVEVEVENFEILYC